MTEKNFTATMREILAPTTKPMRAILDRMTLKHDVNEKELANIESLLLKHGFGVMVASSLVGSLERHHFRNELSGENIALIFSDELIKLLTPLEVSFSIFDGWQLTILSLCGLDKERRRHLMAQWQDLLQSEHYEAELIEGALDKKLIEKSLRQQKDILMVDGDKNNNMDAFNSSKWQVKEIEIISMADENLSPSQKEGLLLCDIGGNEAGRIVSYMMGSSSARRIFAMSLHERQFGLFSARDFCDALLGVHR